MAHNTPDANVYFVPSQSRWPFVGSISMLVLMVGYTCAGLLLLFSP